MRLFLELGLRTVFAQSDIYIRICGLDAKDASPDLDKAITGISSGRGDPGCGSENNHQQVFDKKRINP